MVRPVTFLIFSLISCGVENKRRASTPEVTKENMTVPNVQKSRCSNIHGERRFADQVIRAYGALGTDFADPSKAINGVFGGGLFLGSTDVFSLDQTSDNVLVLSWSNTTVCNLPGPDLAVFENAFFIDEEKLHPFIEPSLVSVSYNGKDWAAFSHHYLGALVEGKRNVFRSPGSKQRADWIGFAGLNPVRFHEEKWGLKQCIDPMDQELAGGDQFDIDQLERTEVGLSIRKTGFRFVKIEAPSIRDNPETCPVPCKKYPISGFSDIDGVYARCFTELP